MTRSDVKTASYTEQMASYLENSSETMIVETVETEIIPSLLRMLVPMDQLREPPARGSATNGVQRNGIHRPPVSDWIKSLSDTASEPLDASLLLPSSELTPNTFFQAESPNWIEVADFAVLLTEDSDDVAMNAVHQLREEGASDEHILLKLLAPASIELGNRWEADLNNFADVTLGVCRLHRILRALHPESKRQLDAGAHGGRVLLAPTTGDQHSFGVLLIGELLFRAGWYTDINIDPDRPALQTMVRRNWFELVGVSVSCESKLEDTRHLITAIRSESCNPDIGILVGGRVFHDNEHLAIELGADGAVTDGAAIADAAARFIPEQKHV